MTAFGATVATYGGILLLAAVVEGLVEYFARPIAARIYAWARHDGQVPDTLPALRYVSALVGVGLCIAYSADLLAIVGLESQIPYIGAIVTGLLVGRGANFVNDFASRYLVHPE